jgi:hypothetical protein
MNDKDVLPLIIMLYYHHTKCLIAPLPYRDQDRMVVGLTTTYVISVSHIGFCEFESQSGRGVQHYVIKFVSDLRQVGGFCQACKQ